jgi:alpha-tubulin suppressor-like RCC1 family protein
MKKNSLLISFILSLILYSQANLIPKHAVQVAAGDNYCLALKYDGTVWAWGDNEFGQLGDGSTTTNKNTPVKVSGLSNISMIAAGKSHSLALKNDGSVWAWGENQNGQLGDGTNTNKTTPVQVSNLFNVSMIVAGDYYSLALKDDSSVWTWGYNYYGQLGDGSTTNKNTPIKVTGLFNVTMVAVGDRHSLVLKNDGSVWAWGYNGSGQLGDGSTTNKFTPVQVPELSNVTMIATGEHHSMVLTDNDLVWAWGNNHYGQLADGSTIDRSSPVKVTCLSNVSLIAAGISHSLALKDDGSIWAWGSNYYGQLGDGTTQNKSSPIQLSGISSVTSITAGKYYSLAIKKNGSIWAWGYNYYGQLGDGRTKEICSPMQVSGLSHVTMISAGETHSLAINEDSSVRAWGQNYHGQLGDGTTRKKSCPTKVSKLSNISIIDAGESHSLAIKEDGSVWAWGYNACGQLGDGTNINKSSPLQISGLSNIIMIAAGYHHSIALKNDASIWAWGCNAHGELSSPVQISGLSDVTMIAAEDHHTLALKDDGSVWAWGLNSSGVLGDGTSESRTSPVQVSDLLHVTRIATGDSHSLALKNDGSVWAWGNNNYGQLGDGTKIGKKTPVKVYGLSNCTKIAAGASHSIAIKDDGTVWAWGYNVHGELGDGTTTEKSTPVQVPGLSHITMISAGDSHNLAIQDNGAAWSWGYNEYGQLGLGYPTYLPEPVNSEIQFNQKTFTTSQNSTIIIPVVNTAQKDITFSFTTKDGTAIAGIDYLQTSGNLTFQANEPQKDIQITILNNPDSQNDKSFVLNLDAPDDIFLNDGAQSIITIGSQHVVNSPYTQTFSQNMPANGWSYYSSQSTGRIHSTSGRLRMDSSQEYIPNLNEAILHIDLSSADYVNLNFFQKSIASDICTSLPETYTKHFNGDGVSISNDGHTWYSIIKCNDLTTDSLGKSYTINLNAAESFIMANYDANFYLNDLIQIKFQQYGQRTYPSGGREWDNIQVTGLFIDKHAFTCRIPDTGQTKCYDHEKEILCPNPGEDFYGQDASYNINPQSFTKLDAQGNELPDSATEWTMVRDNITGLIWEVKTDDGSIHDKDNTYTWYDSNPETNGGDAGTEGDGTDTEDFIKMLNDIKYGGFNDWRLPTMKELISLANFGKAGPPINTSYFPKTKSVLYWSCNYKASSVKNALGVTFGFGSCWFTSKSSSYYVRAVRSKKCRSFEKFVINDHETVTDTFTGLMWQKESSLNGMNWQRAIEHGKALSISDYNDWRLPTIKELFTIVDFLRYPAINKNIFDGHLPAFYWSSTPTANNIDPAWVIDFEHGNNYNHHKSVSYYVRVVRGGQHQASDTLLILSPNQASIWHIKEKMPIKWDTQNITENVTISISREGGKSGTYIPIASNIPNDGNFQWTITQPPSVNCMLRIEPVNNPDKGTSQGLFTIYNPTPRDKNIELIYNTDKSISDNASPGSTVAYLTSNAGALSLTDSQFTLELLFANNWKLKTSPTFNLNNTESSGYYYYTINVEGETASESFALKIENQKKSFELGSILTQTTNEDTAISAIPLTVTNIETTECHLDLSFYSSDSSLITPENISYTCISDTFYISLSPTKDRNGVTEITITAMNAKNLTSSISFEITVLPINDPPKAFNADFFTLENQSINGQLSALDQDSEISDFSIVSHPEKGIVHMTNNGEFTYTPTQNKYGKDAFEYKVYDTENTGSNTALVSIFITSTNNPPVANSSNNILDEDKHIYIKLIATDSDNDNLTYHIITHPTHGRMTLSDDTVLYTPNPDYNGPDSFTYKVNDGISDSNTATIMITVFPVYDIPQAINQNVITTENMPVNITLTASSPDNKSLTYQIKSQPAHGILSQSTPYLTYTPNHHFYGTDEFTFIANDSISDSLPETISIFVARNTHYLLKLVGPGHGTVRINSTSVLLPYTTALQADQEVCFEAVPDSDWQFINWTGDLQSSENPACVILDQNKTITANMEIQTFVLCIEGSEAITINNASQTLPFSKEYEIHTPISLESDSELFNCWERNRFIDDNPYTFKIDSDMSITAIFYPEPDWQTSIQVERLVDNNDIQQQASVIIGAASQGYTKYSEALPETYSCDIVLNNESFERLSKVILHNNAGEYQWIISVHPRGNIGNEFVSTTARLSWNPLAFSSKGQYMLKTYTDEMLISDMRQTTEYQVTDNAYALFKIIWQKLETFDFHLNQGWNLISLPLTPSNTDLSQLFQDYEAAYGYKNGAYNPVTSFIPGEGYWLKIPSQKVYTISGQPYHSYTTDFFDGWHLIGAPTNGITPDDMSIKVIFRYVNGGYEQAFTLLPGFGYWIKIGE